MVLTNVEHSEEPQEDKDKSCCCHANALRSRSSGEFRLPNERRQQEERNTLYDEGHFQTLYASHSVHDQRGSSSTEDLKHVSTFRVTWVCLKLAPNVLTKPPSHEDLYESNPARVKS